MTDNAFKCRGCDSPDHAVLLEMGRLPLANAFVKDETATDDAFTEFLTLVLCRSCCLLQIREAVPREKLFGSYLWVTSTSDTVKDYARWFFQRLRDRHHRKSNPLLVEVASNDGFFLEHYRDAGFAILGVDPSNLAEEADARGLRSIREFFGRDAAGAHGGGFVIGRTASRSAGGGRMQNDAHPSSMGPAWSARVPN